MMNYDEEHPWTRQPCDDDRKWRAFVCYRDGVLPRTLLSCAQATGESPRELGVWCKEDQWELRVAEYDRWLDLQRSSQVSAILGEDAIARAGRHIALLRGMQEVVGASVRDWLRRVSMGEVIVQNPRDVVRAIKDMVTLERLVHGQTTSNVQLSGSVDLGKLSLDELETLRALQAKAEGKAEE